MALVLGVIDMPYAEDSSGGPVEMTGQVATKLERNYGIMNFFFNAHQDDIALMLEDSFAGSLANALMGAPKQADTALFNQACSKIETKFKYFIDNAEMDFKIPGVPTKDAIDRALGKRRSNRMKKKKVSEINKPISFYDTGLYQASFKSWVEP